MKRSGVNFFGGITNVFENKKNNDRGYALRARLYHDDLRAHPYRTFLKYDPKDVMIAVSGFIFGPLTSFSVALIVSFAEMFTASDTGILGFLMNVISSCAFACTAALIYRKRHTLSGAMIGLLCGWGCMTAVMSLWNYLITPIYMGYPREAVVKLLLPAFLPFNLIKGGLNAAITTLLYKPVVTILRRTRLLEVKSDSAAKPRINIGIVLISLLIIATCVLLTLSFNGVI